VRGKITAPLAQTDDTDEPRSRHIREVRAFGTPPAWGGHEVTAAPRRFATNDRVAARLLLYRDVLRVDHLLVDGFVRARRP